MYLIIKDGLVIATCDSQPCEIDLSARNETCIESDIADMGWTYKNNEFILSKALETSIISPLIAIRKTRDTLLSQSDKYMIMDYPITEQERNEWKSYRQALRDFPEICDVNNPVWPIKPTQGGD